MQRCRDLRLFDGLHGVFADSLPDGWGLILMNRALRQQAGWRPQEIGPLDRLAYIGSRGMGALEYRPATDVPTAPLDWAELERMGTEAQLVLSGAADDVLAALRVHGGSPGGARPKVVVALHPGLRQCHSSLEPLRPGFRHWLVKFRGQDDPPDMGAIEYAYNRMADAARLRVPHAGLLDVRLGKTPERLFAVERFDRDGDHKRHVLSLAGYAYADFRLPSLDYDQVLGATMAICRDHQEVVQAFRLMVFNVLTHNQDDHAKNFSFLHQDERWTLAPAYDLTFSRVGAQSQHSTSVSGSGRPGRRDVLALARAYRIDNAEAIIDEIRGVVADWRRFGEAAGVARGTIDQLMQEFERIDERF